MCGEVKAQNNHNESKYYFSSIVKVNFYKLLSG